MILLILFMNILPVKMTSGLATIYWPGDGHCGKIRADGKKFTAEDGHIAHRTLPLGTRGFFCTSRTNRCVRTVVRDRGPWGQIIRCDRAPDETKGKVRRIRWRKACHLWRRGKSAKDLPAGWAWRGEFDTTKPVADAIGHRQFDKGYFVYTVKPRLRRK